MHTRHMMGQLKLCSTLTFLFKYNIFCSMYTSTYVTQGIENDVSPRPPNLTLASVTLTSHPRLPITIQMLIIEAFLRGK